jgi:hypothetical protein
LTTITQGHLAIVEYFVETCGVYLLDDEDSSSALYVAAKFGRLEVCAATSPAHNVKSGG